MANHTPKPSYDELKSILTEHTMKDAKKIIGVGDYLLSKWCREYGLSRYDLRHKSLPPLTESQNNIISGCLLGDGCIPKSSKKNCRLFVRQKTERREFLEYLFTQLQPYSKNINDSICKLKVNDITKQYPSSCLYTIFSPFFTDLRSKWYNDEGKKIIPFEFELNWHIVAIWFVCDGCWNSDTSLKLCTESFSHEDVSYLCSRLKKDLGIDSVEWNRNNKFKVIGIKGENVDIFMSHISPYLAQLNCFKYKMQNRMQAFRNKLNKEKILNIIELWNKGESQKELARKFHVDPSTVHQIIHRKIWKDVTEGIVIRGSWHRLDTETKRKVVTLRQQGYKMADIAEQCNISVASVSKILSGKKFGETAIVQAIYNENQPKGRVFNEDMSIPKYTLTGCADVSVIYNPC